MAKVQLNPVLQLANDVHIAEEMLKENDSQYLRRCYIRALFAAIEGTVFMLKQTAFTYSVSPPGLSNYKQSISISELVLLQEISIELGNNGKILHNKKFLRIEDNLVFTARVLSKIFDCRLNVDIGNKKLANFRKSIAIRNRITHPKSLKEFQISDNDIAIVQEVSDWITNLTYDAISKIVDKIREVNNVKRQNSEEVRPLDLS